jgi:hypothetical protein
MPGLVVNAFLVWGIMLQVFAIRVALGLSTGRAIVASAISTALVIGLIILAALVFISQSGASVPTG